jgi:arginyl-tRNA synthetase
MEALEQSLGSLSLSTPIPYIDTAEVLANPLDVCRTYLAQILAEVAGCDINTAYTSIQWPNNISNGDLSVTIPKLRPGCKPAELSAGLVNKVGPPLPYQAMSKGLTLRVVSERPHPVRSSSS